VRALIREISSNRILATSILFLIIAFLLALLSIFPEHHTYSNEASEAISSGNWTIPPLQPPSDLTPNLRISESYLHATSNVNLTINLYANEMLLNAFNLTSNQERIVDLSRETSVLILNGTSTAVGEITLSYTIKGFTLPWNMLGVPAMVLMIFGVILSIKGYQSFMAKIKKVTVKKQFFDG